MFPARKRGRPRKDPLAPGMLASDQHCINGICDIIREANAGCIDLLVCAAGKCQVIARICPADPD